VGFSTQRGLKTNKVDHTLQMRDHFGDATYASYSIARYVLPAATREISELLVNCLVRSAELLSLLFCDLSGGLPSLPASQ
jgi:hypothetical protein